MNLFSYEKPAPRIAILVGLVWAADFGEKSKTCAGSTYLKLIVFDISSCAAEPIDNFTAPRLMVGGTLHTTEPGSIEVILTNLSSMRHTR